MNILEDSCSPKHADHSAIQAASAIFAVTGFDLSRPQTCFLKARHFCWMALKALAAGLCIAVLASTAESKPLECSAYWLRIWNTRSDSQAWSYVDLSYYAKFGAHPNIAGYSSIDISTYFAALAIRNKQGLSLSSHSTSLESLNRQNRAASMRYVIARYYGLSLPDWEGRNMPDQCVFSQSSACIERLTRSLLPKATKMRLLLEDAARSGQLGKVPCEGGIQYYGRKQLR